MFYQVHLQPHLRLRHVTLTDTHNDNPESLRKCCIMSDIVIGDVKICDGEKAESAWMPADLTNLERDELLCGCS